MLPGGQLACRGGSSCPVNFPRCCSKNVRLLATLGANWNTIMRRLADIHPHFKRFVLVQVVKSDAKISQITSLPRFQCVFEPRVERSKIVTRS